MDPLLRDMINDCEDPDIRRFFIKHAKICEIVDASENQIETGKVLRLLSELFRK